MGAPVESPLDLLEISADPGSPASGVLRLYAKTDGNLYYKSPGAVVVALTTSGRLTGTITSSSLGNNASQQTSLTLTRAFRLVKIQTDRAARVRLYDRAAKQAADINRASATKPTGDHGVILDYVTTASVLSASLLPQAEGDSMESTPTTSCPITIQNLSGSTHTVVVTLTYVMLEP